MQRLILAVIFFAIFAPVATAQQARKPNIVVIVGDDMGYGDVGFHGCKDIPTPNLDALAKSGVRFTSGYVSGPYCSPTRAGLLTGRYQTRFGHEFNPSGGPRQGLPVTETTLATLLRDAGYATGLIGKWHLGSEDVFHPLNRGFGEFFGFLGGAHSYFPDKGSSVVRGKSAANEKEYLTDAIARESVAFINKHKTEPYFLYVAFNAVHTPMHATDERLQRFNSIEDKTRRTYAAMMVAMDEAIGKIVAAIRETGQEENTLIFFISDNGGPTMVGTTTNGSINRPLRGSKRTTLEGGIRVPFLASWKGKMPAGAVYDHPVIQLDIFPTALAVAGVERTSKTKLDGVDLLPYVTGKNASPPHQHLYWRFGPQMAIRSGDWVLVRYDTHYDNGPKAKGKAVTEPHLYNVTADIGQTKNLAATHPDKMRELQTEWDRWNAELVPALWGSGKAGGKGE